MPPQAQAENLLKDEVYQSSAVIISEPETSEFYWDFHVSPRSKIQKNIESVSFGGFNFNGLQFKTGFLANTDHKWGLSLYSNQINTFMSLPKRDVHHRYMVLDSRLELMSKNAVEKSHTLTFQRDETVAAPRCLWTSFWVNKDKSWNDTIDNIRIIFRVGRESRRCLYTLVSQQAVSRNLEILSTIKHVDCRELYLSNHLSDVVLQCGDKEYPAHRLILSCRSSVFNRMFHVEMKEGVEGRVTIEAMEPKVLEELLRFIYCSEVSPSSLHDICSDLFEASDRFDIEPLKILCENEMVKKLNGENAFDMYIQAELHDAKVLKERSFNVILQNKKKVFDDLETFKIFSSRYPDILFDMFNFCT